MLTGIKFQRHEGVGVLEIAPEISQIALSDLEAAASNLGRLLVADNVHHVAIDLTGLTEFPSSLNVALLQIWKVLDQKQRQFAIASNDEHVRAELGASGLLNLWSLTNSLDDAVLQLGGPLKATPSRADDPGLSETAEMAMVSQNESSEPLDFKLNKEFASVRLNSVLMEMPWSEVEAATSGVIAQLDELEVSNLMIDLSSMSIINSALVAALVRMWKNVRERGGQMSVVCSNEDVEGVLATAGLAKLWNIVGSREEGVYELGVSSGAKVEQRERAILANTAVPCAVLAAAAMVPVLMNSDEQVLGFEFKFQLAAILLGAAGLAIGILSILKEQGFRRKVSVVAVAVSVVVLSSLWFKNNPISFTKPIPHRDFNRS